MPDSDPRISVSSIVVEGLDAEATQRAEIDVRVLLAPFEQAALDLIGDVELAVLITDQMAEQVDRIRRDCGIVAPPYRREKEAGISGGIVVSAPGGPPFRDTLILHNELWAHSSGIDTAERVYVFGYIFAHVLHKRHGTGADWESRRGAPYTFAGELSSNAAALIDAFDADLTAHVFCRQFLRLDSGEPVRMSALIGERVVADAHELAEKLCVFAAIDVQIYRVTSVELEELLPTVRPLLGEILLVLVHVLALYAGDDNLPALLDALESSPGIRAYILPDVEAIKSALMDSDPAARESRLVGVLERILARLGLRVEDLPDGGLYVHVSEPVMCELPVAGSS